MASITSEEPELKRRKQQHFCPSCESVVNVAETNWSRSGEVKAEAEADSETEAGAETVATATESESNWDSRRRQKTAQEDKSELLDQEEEEAAEEVPSSVKCTSCDKSVGLLVHGQFKSVEELLLRDDRRNELNSWVRVKDEADRRVLYTLSQVLYNEYEISEEEQEKNKKEKTEGNEDEDFCCQFAFPPASDIAKILWVNGEAVGFYTVKLKGTLDTETFFHYSMDSLDTVFIRKAHRRKQFASSALIDLLNDFPDRNIGFSSPISFAMMKVLAKHLEKRAEDRTRLWEIENYGTTLGHCRNLWLILQRQRKVGGPQKLQLTNNNPNSQNKNKNNN